MKIDLGKYRLCSDSYSMWIEKKVVKKNKVTWPIVTGYCSKWEDLFNSFMNRAIRDSHATTAKQLLKDVELAKRDALKLFKAIKLPNEKDIMKP